MINWKLYVILDKELSEGKDIKKLATQVIKGGADVIQLRDKISSDHVFVENAKIVQDMTRRYSIPFIVNDRIGVAEAIDADGLHLGQDDIPIEDAKYILGKSKLIGISCHSIKDATEAEKRGADYIGLGPIFKTTTKPHLKPIGPGLIGELKEILKIPIVCIGGINENNVEELLKSGVSTIAIASAIVKAHNPLLATQKIKRILETKYDTVRIC